LEFLLFRPDRCEATPSIRCVYCISDSSTLLADGRKKKKVKTFRVSWSPSTPAGTTSVAFPQGKSKILICLEILDMVHPCIDNNCQPLSINSFWAQNQLTISYVFWDTSQMWIQVIEIHSCWRKLGQWQCRST
jgi:hypothetical protein